MIFFTLLPFPYSSSPYKVAASLAWNVKAWFAMMLRVRERSE
ncbi:MAG: hypothetical protein R2684_14725 [Pyrinomonadaceae bacterium]